MNGLAPKIYFTAAREVPLIFGSVGHRGESTVTTSRGTVDEPNDFGGSRATSPRRSMSEASVAGLPPPARSSGLSTGFGYASMEAECASTFAPGRSFGEWFARYVAGLLACEEGHLPLNQLTEAANGTRRLSLPLAPADALVLWDVRYPVRWTVRYPRRTREQEAHLREARRRAEVRARVVKVL